MGEASIAAREMYAKQTMIYAVINVHSQILFGAVFFGTESVQIDMRIDGVGGIERWSKLRSG